MTLVDVGFEHLTLVVYSPPKVMRLTVDLYELVVQLPLPDRIGSHPVHPKSADFGSEPWPEPVPSEPNRIMSEFDAALMHQILNNAKRQRKAKTHDNCQANDLRTGFEVAKGGAFCHPQTLRDRPVRLRRVSSDSAATRISHHVRVWCAKNDAWSVLLHKDCPSSKKVTGHASDCGKYALAW